MTCILDVVFVILNYWEP